MTENTSTPWPTYLPGQSAIHGDWFNGFGTSQPQLLNPSDPAFRPPIVFDRGTTTDLAAAVDFGAMAEGSVLSGDGTGSIANSVSFGYWRLPTLAYIADCILGLEARGYISKIS